MRTYLLLAVCLCTFIPTLLAQDAERPAKVNAENVKLRAQPSAKARIVATLKKGGEVSVLEQKAEWSRVRAGKNTGWLESSRLDMSASGEVPGSTPAAEAGRARFDPYVDQPVPDLAEVQPVAMNTGLDGALLLEALVTQSGAQMRSYPGSQAPVLQALPERGVVLVVERSDRWIKCEYEGLTGWVEREKLTLRGTRPTASASASAARSARIDDELHTTVERLDDEGLKKASAAAVEDERRLRASLAALDTRSQRDDGSDVAGLSASGEHFLRGLQTDASRLGTACADLEALAEHAPSESDRNAARFIADAGRRTLENYRQSVARAQSAPPSTTLLYGGNISAAIGSHTRTAVYEYKSSVPTVQASAWMNTPQYGNFRGRLDWTDDVVTTRFTRLNTGLDWRLPQGTHQWNARVNFFRYDDQIPVNTYGLIDLQAGWEQLRQQGPAWFARAMYQGKSFSETQPQDFSAVSLNAGLRTMAPYGQAFELNMLNRYQSSEDMGLNFNMVTAFALWRSESGFSIRPAYEGYMTLADSNGAFLNYHRPGLELRWSKATGITDYGARIDYRYHPDASNLTYGQASLFAGHHTRELTGTQWDALLLFQQNNGTLNPSYMQANADARHTAGTFFLGLNGVARYVLAESADSLSQHFTDLYLNPGVIITIATVRIEAGPFIGTTLFLNNKTRSIKDNLNNSARTGVSLHALASFESRVNVRAWAEYERAFHFIEDPYAGRKRSPMRLRLGAEANVVVVGSLSVFGRAQYYSLDNDTRIQIQLPGGTRDRDKIDDTLLLVGLRYAM
ncbi:MAG: SH3 domain-containing protein [Ignavibacteriae bacterium]|nr:SH3 domain-containing protein [Ignavibacteriota bacterium]